MYGRLGSIQARGIGQTGHHREAPHGSFPSFIGGCIAACFTQQRAPQRSSDAPNYSCVLTSWFRRITDFPALRDGALREYGTSVGGQG